MVLLPGLPEEGWPQPLRPQGVQAGTPGQAAQPVPLQQARQLGLQLLQPVLQQDLQLPGGYRLQQVPEQVLLLGHLVPRALGLLLRRRLLNLLLLLLQLPWLLPLLLLLAVLLQLLWVLPWPLP